MQEKGTARNNIIRIYRERLAESEHGKDLPVLPLSLVARREGHMSRRRKNKLSRFVAMPWEIIDSLAWQGLTNAARVTLIHLKRKVVSANPGEITLSYHEMEKIMNRHTFAKALRQLEQSGFITKEQYGGLYRKRNFFKLSEGWRKQGQGSSANNGTVTSAKSGTVGSKSRG